MELVDQFLPEEHVHVPEQYLQVLSSAGEEAFFDSDGLMYYNFDVKSYEKEFSAFRKNFEVFPARTNDPD